MDPHLSRQKPGSVTNGDFNSFNGGPSARLLLDCMVNDQPDQLQDQFTRSQPEVGASFTHYLLSSLLELFNKRQQQQQQHFTETIALKSVSTTEPLNYSSTAGANINNTNYINYSGVAGNFSSTSFNGDQSTKITQSALPISAESPYQLEALSERWQVYLAILYSLTAVTSFVLNVITVIVLSRYRRSELRRYLINLSMSDLLMSLFSIPFTYTEYMLGRWIFASFLCPLVRFVVTLSVFVSVATMTVIGINRHLAIMYPFRKKKCSRFRHWTLRKTHVIIAIWLIGIAISTPEYLMFSAEPFCYNKQFYYDCRQLWPESISNPYTIFIYLSTFAIPLSLLSYLYTSIGLKLWRRQMPGNVDINRDLSMQTMRVKIIKMLFVVVVLFAVSWLPLQTFSMIMFLYPEIRQDFVYQSTEYNIFIGTYFACHWLSMAHSCLNPLIYCFMNGKFRSDLHDLLCNRNKCFSFLFPTNPQQLNQPTHSNYTAHSLHHFSTSIKTNQTRVNFNSSYTGGANGHAHSAKPAALFGANQSSSDNQRTIDGGEILEVHSTCFEENTLNRRQAEEGPFVERNLLKQNGDGPHVFAHKCSLDSTAINRDSSVEKEEDLGDFELELEFGNDLVTNSIANV